MKTGGGIVSAYPAAGFYFITAVLLILNLIPQRASIPR